MLPVLRRLGLRAFSMASDSYSSGTHSAAFVTCPNDTVAKELARGIVEKKLAALKLLIISAAVFGSDTLRLSSEHTAVLSESNHPYEVAEVISLPIDQGNPPYLKWIGDTVPE
uniref:CutA divalent cation tolerance homolog n=1 Tax=Sinocyclocheilus grahami TaxID=75366 RepID=A0A672Q5U4_SINGR